MKTLISGRKAGAFVEAAYDNCVTTWSWVLELATSRWGSLAPNSKIAVCFALALMYAAGGVLWYYFMHRGVIPLDLHDWGEVTSPRYAFLQNAFRTGQLPLHMPIPAALRNVTDRFMAVPDTNLFPLVLLLRWMDLGRFFLVNILFFYTIGYAGLLLLWRRLKLSLVSFTILFLLLFFNGHVTDHIAVGHENWSAVFLLPYYVYLMLDLLDSPRPWGWTLGFSLLILAILLEGAFHLFVNCLLFVAILGIAEKRLLPFVFKAVAFSGLVGMLRLAPALLVVGKFDTDFLSGFSTFEELVAGLGKLVPPIRAQVFGFSRVSPLGWWEVDYYIGGLGVMFLLFFGVYRWIRNRDKLHGLNSVAAPILVIAILSIGRLYSLVHILHFPLLDSERVATRLFILPFVFLIVVTARNIQISLDRSESDLWRLGTVLGLGVLANDLWQHFTLWRVWNMSDLFPHKAVELSRNIVANHPDPTYYGLLLAGLGISTAALSYLIVQTSREHRSLSTASDVRVRAP